MKKQETIDKFGYCLDAYIRHAADVRDMYFSLMPRDFTAEVLCQENYTSKNLLTGKQIWESIWEPTNRAVANGLMPDWMRFTRIRLECNWTMFYITFVSTNLI